MADIEVRCFKMTKSLFLEGYCVRSPVKRVIDFKAKCKRSNADSWVEDRGLDPTRCVMLWPWVDRDGGKWQRLCF